jgi:hypothetical protein
MVIRFVVVPSLVIQSRVVKPRRQVPIKDEVNERARGVQLVKACRSRGSTAFWRRRRKQLHPYIATHHYSMNDTDAAAVLRDGKIVFLTDSCETVLALWHLAS